jgi:hypothetical protein
MAFQVAMPTSMVATQACERTLSMEYDALPSPGVNPLRVHQSIVAESWDSEGAPDFQL